MDPTIWSEYIDHTLNGEIPIAPPIGLSIIAEISLYEIDATLPITISPLINWYDELRIKYWKSITKAHGTHASPR